MRKTIVIVMANALCLALLFSACNQKKKQASDAGTVNTTETVYTAPKPPEKLTAKEDQLNYVFEHYWDNFNFSDTTKILNPDYGEQALVNYVAMFPAMPVEKVNEGMEDFLDQAKQEQKGFDYFKQKLDSYLFDPNSPMRSDLFYEPVLVYYTSSDKVSADEKMRYRILLDLVRKNKVNSIATNFQFKTKIKPVNSLTDFQSPLTLLFFYEPGCSNCEEVIGQLKQQESINKMIADKKFQILAIYPEGSLEIWEDYAAQIPSNWINGVDENQVVLNTGLYDLKASPTIYLLDKDKRVILKDTDLAGLGQYLMDNGL
ncbi:DUF5106 domain-containing protein [Sphingobacterium sp. DK4209]|uniref:DUF5106 domain-containing protein n=1 Tax=Sphingobacterium zhuxiongii TaxID=2662364 RepID=A0A5Q0QB45_9SPHI|nr:MULTISPECIES: DUF5106 domain-containing protein [unclassified Sphingobacterium]MVZ65299.1 DUF5106 domain-containing protein [Sphingobacterium sp. DK4209]QGA26389.1 DUF5106 domain-containing protein [Sphingobacterium sp. dk4302]